MKKILLNSSWSLTYVEPADGVTRTIPAQVPGNVLGDLERANVIPDPFYGSNSVALRPYEFIDWEYRTTFDAPVVSEREKPVLVFEGIDTVAEIILNGKTIGNAENMFIEHRFPLAKDELKPTGNELVVRIKSSFNCARKFSPPPFSGGNDNLYLRRARHTAGWDICPRLMGAGLWRNVYLELESPEHWTELYISHFVVSEKSCIFKLHWNFESDLPTFEAFKAHLKMQCGDHVFERSFDLYFTSGKNMFTIDNAKLWYPAGAGDPNLYDVTLELIHHGEAVDTRKWRHGFRTIDLKRSEDLLGPEKGEFVFIINDKKTFIKGSNWVPSDALHGERPERTIQSLKLFTELGCNMVRCWGGNVYEDHEFFDYCDEHGLLVWQDFMFACEVAPQDDEFLAKVRTEAIAVVSKLRRHASLAVWCGDNECDGVMIYPPYNKYGASTNRVTREVLPRVIIDYDPERCYLPSSSYLSDRVCKMGQDLRSYWFYLEAKGPEQHLWGCRDSWKNRFYKHNTAIFAGEIGYHGMPDVRSVEKFIPEAEYNKRHDSAWVVHASQAFGLLDGGHASRNYLMEKQFRNFWGYLAEDLTEFMKGSQIVQAEAMKYMIELFRAKKWDKTGILWWNVIDCWPQFSDAVVDYYYTKKLAFYYIRNSQKPVTMIVSDPENWVSQLTISNDTPFPVKGTYKVTDLMTGEVFCEGEYDAPADSAEVVTEFEVCQSDKRMLLIEWQLNGTTHYNHYLLGDAAFDLNTYLEYLKKLDTLLYAEMGRNEW